MLKLLLGFTLLFCSIVLNSNVCLAQSGVGVRTAYAGTPVGTSNWVPLVTSSAQQITQVSIFDSSAQTLELGICPSAQSSNSEVRQLLIPPGGVDQKLYIPIGYRISIRAVSANATSGENDSNFVY